MRLVAFIFSFFQESIESRASDAGLEAIMDRMNISEAKNIEMISKEYELNETEIKIHLAEDDRQDTLTEDTVNSVSIDEAEMAKIIYNDHCNDEYCDSLEVFCQERIIITHQALDQV